jgi:hypothetical protein
MCSCTEICERWVLHASWCYLETGSVQVEGLLASLVSMFAELPLMHWWCHDARLSFIRKHDVAAARHVSNIAGAHESMPTRFNVRALPLAAVGQEHGALSHPRAAERLLVQRSRCCRPWHRLVPLPPPSAEQSAAATASAA